MIVDLELTHCTRDLDIVFHQAKDAGLDSKSSREVCYCWDMFQIWHDWIDHKFGRLKTLRHRSPPDDPPDIQLIFDARIIDFEHTRLQPYPLGWAEDVKHTEFPNLATAVPALSKPPKNRAELLHSMVSLDAPWAAVGDELKVAAQSLVETLRKKMIRLPDGGIIGIVDETSYSHNDVQRLFEIAEHFVNSRNFSDFDRYTLIILNRPNPLQYRSALIIRGNKMETRGE
jgi:hypothetical protein